MHDEILYCTLNAVVFEFTTVASHRMSCFVEQSDVAAVLNFG
jgi:hypothetical protein